MSQGAVALVLHAHLPYVRSAQPGSLEEDWFFQALIECYLPLLDALERAAADPAQAPKLTIGLSPTLLSLLSDPDLKQRFPSWIQSRIDLLPKADPQLDENRDALVLWCQQFAFAPEMNQACSSILTCRET